MCPLAQLEVAAHDVIEKLDAVKLVDDLVHPCPNIAAQHQRISGNAPARVFVGHEGRRWDTGDLSLLVGHLVELGNIDFNGSLGACYIFFF